VVGPSRPLPAGIRTVVEDPPGVGAAAISAAMPLVVNPWSWYWRVICRSSRRKSLTVWWRPCRLDARVSPASTPPLYRTRRARPASTPPSSLTEAVVASFSLGPTERLPCDEPSQTSAPRRDGCHRLVTHFRITEVVADETVTLDCDTWDDITLVRDKLERHDLTAWTESCAVPWGSTSGRDRCHLDLARDAAHEVERPSRSSDQFLVGYAAGLRGGSTDDIADCIESQRISRRALGRASGDCWEP
jgi:hypothetical protein